MEPQVRYCTTSDGVSIAYYSVGNGPPLIVVPAGLNQSIEFDGKVSNLRAAAEASAQVWTYVRYDPRGSGLSDRDVDAFPLEAMTYDIRAVADALGVDQFRLFAAGLTGMAGVAFAALHPARVSHLVLWASAAHGREFVRGPTEQLRDLIETDWRVASEAITWTIDHWDNPDLAREHAETMRASVEPSTYRRYLDATEQWDLTALLPSITCPTLVIHPAANAYAPVARARRLAAAIPNARLTLVESRSLLMPGMEVVRVAGRFFLGRDEPPAAAREPKKASPAATAGAMAVILFADIVDSTAITGRIGNAAFRDRSRRLEEALRTAIRHAGGAPVEGRTLGDGVLGDFSSSSQAIGAAIACKEAAANVGFALHLGLHAGDVIREAGNVHGIAVSMASRISALSGPNEILVSSTVRDLARASADVTFEDRGEHELKGVADAVRVFAVQGAR